MKLDIYGMVEKNMISEIKKLIKDGIDINKVNEFDCTPLCLAMSNKHEEMALLLLDNGADGSFQNNDGFTALHYAMEFNMPSIAKAILNKTPNALHIENKHGNEPLYTATNNGEIPFDFIEFLLKMGANKNHKNKYGNTPFDLVKDFNIEEFTKLFERY